MSNETVKEFRVIGIAMRTTNESGQSAKDIPQLWAKFMGQGMAQRITEKVSETIYAIYTDYEQDHTKPYTVIIGCEVNDRAVLPSGMVEKRIEGGKFSKLVAKGSINNGSVYDAWVKIWNSDMDRAFLSDFEVYGPKAIDPENAEVDIFVSIK